MSLIDKVGKVLPSSLADIGEKSYIHGSRLLGRNYYNYEYNESLLRLYYTEPTFGSIRILYKVEQ
jgi:hypothetical protein